VRHGTLTLVATDDSELQQLESRWRAIGLVVLALTCVLMLSVIAWMPKDAARFTKQWDWVYDHHEQLVVVLGVAAVLVGVVALIAWRRSSPRILVWAVAPSLVVLVALVAWVLADRRSNAAEIERRVRQVSEILPEGATRTAASHGDNFLTESYVIDSQVNVVAPAVWASAKEHLGRSAGLWGDPKQGDAPTYVALSFPGGYGCDGSLQVNLVLADATGMTTASVGGSCED